ncbi:hypothetical protein ABLA76_18150 [Xenorhabdus sp. SGI240]
MPESVAMRRLRVLCHPPPQNVRPPPKQVGPRSPVAESEKLHKIRLFSSSQGKQEAILHNGLRR